MKATKFLPLLLIAPLLAGCGKSVKAPKFADLGSELEFAKFTEALEKANEESALMKEDKLPSLTFSSEEKILSSSKVTRHDVVTQETSRYYVDKEVYKTDTANSLMEWDVKETEDYATKDSGRVQKEKTRENYVRLFQEASIEDKKYCVKVNEKFKEYSKFTALEDEYKMADLIDDYIKTEILNEGSQLEYMMYMYAFASEEDQKDFKFYQNGKVFTLVYEHKDENKETKDSEDKVLYVVNSHALSKIQVDVTDGNLKFTSYSESSSTTEYKKELQGHLAGEVYVEEGKSSKVSTAVYKENKLKAVDLASFVEIQYL